MVCRRGRGFRPPHCLGLYLARGRGSLGAGESGLHCPGLATQFAKLHITVVIKESARCAARGYNGNNVGPFLFIVLFFYLVADAADNRLRLGAVGGPPPLYLALE